MPKKKPASKGKPPIRKGRTTAPSGSGISRKPPPARNLIEPGLLGYDGKPVRKGRTVAPGTRPYTNSPYNYVPSQSVDTAEARIAAQGPYRYVPGASVDTYEAREAARQRTPVGDIPFTDKGGGGSGYSGGGSSGGGGEGVPVEDPNAQAQADFIARLLAMKNETLAGYKPATNSIRKTYNIASADLNNPYNDYFNAYRQGATNLGLDYNNDDNVKLADAAARKLQETYDLNEAGDLATIEKMKSLNTDSFTQLLVAAEAGLLGPITEVVEDGGGSGGGGGGGGRRGGRRSGGGSGGSDSSGGPFDETATVDEAFYNPGLVNAISGISDPELRDYVDLVYAGTGTNPRSALNRAVSDYEKFSAFKAPPKRNKRGFAQGYFNAVANQRRKALRGQNKKDVAVAQAAINFLKNYSAGYKPQTISQKIKTTAKTKHT